MRYVTLGLIMILSLIIMHFSHNNVIIVITDGFAVICAGILIFDGVTYLNKKK